jgi:hypothetical protein
MALGKAHLELTDTKMTMSGQNSIIGRGVIVHEKEDDLKSQPVGNAGGRIACGVICCRWAIGPNSLAILSRIPHIGVEREIIRFRAG